MAHGERAARWQQGKEYWASRLHEGGEERGSYTKTLTHRKERRANKEMEELCIDCNGKGVDNTGDICPTCNGEGYATE